MLQFTNAVEMKAHYANIKAKFRGPRAVTYVTMPTPPPPPVVEPPPPPRVFVGPDMSKFPQDVIDQFNKTFTNSTKSRMRRIVVDTSDKYSVSIEDIMSSSRNRTLVLARQEAMYRARIEVGTSFPEIGRYFNKDYSTVAHSVKAHTKRMMK
jgi:hypothetical protein